MPADRPPGDPTLVARLDELRTSWGIDFPVARTVLATLAAGVPVPLTTLVEAAALPRRRVQAILHALDAWTISEGDNAGLGPDSAAAVRDWLGDRPRPGHDVSDEWDARVAEVPELTARLGESAAALPPSQWRLDHVPATPETIAKRALYLTWTYDLDGAHLLCVGDHDLTSLAVTLAEPSSRATVVDVDDRLLAYIDESARRFDLDVTCARADLRLGLPVSLAGSAEVAFTDPPYTPVGIGLFLRRGLTGLRRTSPCRVLFCYGFGDRGATRAVEVQALATDLGLAFDAIHPGFSSYRGAEAIGSRSHLYVARPTRTTWPAVDRPRRPDTRIYTRGPEAEERGGSDLADAALAAVAGVLGEGAVTLVGDGWPAAGFPAGGEPRRLRLDQYLERPRPAGGHRGGQPVPRVRGGTRPRRSLPRPAWSRWWWPARRGGPVDWAGRMGRPATSWRRRTTSPSPGRAASAPRPSCRRAAATIPRRGRGARCHRYLVTHRGAKVVNAWREGLIQVAAGAGTTLTKNQARALVADTGPGRSLERLRLEELPLHALAELADLSRRSVQAVLGPDPTDIAGAAGR